MNNQPLSSILDIVVKKMEKENCRLMDTDIMRAINNTTFDTVNNEITNIFVDTRDLVKF